jgi:hypothetical protein
VCVCNCVLRVCCVRIQTPSWVCTAIHASSGTVQPVPGRLDPGQLRKLQSTPHFSGSILKGKRSVHYDANSLSSLHVITAKGEPKVYLKKLFPALQEKSLHKLCFSPDIVSVFTSERHWRRAASKGIEKCRHFVGKLKRR